MWQNVYFEYYGEHWWYCSDTWLSTNIRELWTIHHVTLNIIYYHWENMIYKPDLLKWCVAPLSTVYGLIPAINPLSAVSVKKCKPNLAIAVPEDVIYHSMVNFTKCHKQFGTAPTSHRLNLNCRGPNDFKKSWKNKDSGSISQEKATFSEHIPLN